MDEPEGTPGSSTASTGQAVSEPGGAIRSYTRSSSTATRATIMFRLIPCGSCQVSA